MLMLSVEKELTFPMPSGSEEAPVVVDAIQSRGHLTPRLSVRCWEPHDHDGRNHLGKSVPMRDPAALRGVCTREIQLIDHKLCYAFICTSYHYVVGRWISFWLQLTRVCN